MSQTQQQHDSAHIYHDVLATRLRKWEALTVTASSSATTMPKHRLPGIMCSSVILILTMLSILPHGCPARLCSWCTVRAEGCSYEHDEGDTVCWESMSVLAALTEKRMKRQDWAEEVRWVVSKRMEWWSGGKSRRRCWWRRKGESECCFSISCSLFAVRSLRGNRTHSFNEAR